MISRRPLTQDDVFRTRHVMAGRVAQDGCSAVYQLRGTESADATERVGDRLWWVDRDRGSTIPLTPAEVDASAPWLDGDLLYFLEAAPGVPSQLSRIDLRGGERRGMTDLPGGVTAFSVSPDGTRIALAVSPVPTPAAPVTVITRAFYRSDSFKAPLDQLGQALYVMDAESGEVRQVTTHDGLIVDLLWSPTRDEIAMLVNAREAHGDYLTLGNLVRELVVVDLAGQERSIAGNDWIEEMFWTPDGDRLGFIALPYGDFARQFRLWTVGRMGGERVDRSVGIAAVPGNNVQLNNPTVYSKVGAHVWRATGEVIVPGTIGPTTLPWAFSLDGEPAARPLGDGERTCRILDVQGDQLLISAQSFTEPATLRLIDLATGEEELLADPNGAWTPVIAPPRIAQVVATTCDDAEIEGWIFTPDRPEPPIGTILYIHGGPFMTFGHAYQEDFLELVGAGFAIAFCNPRSSTGYGDAFSTPIVGRWGELERIDLMAFVDRLVEQGLADPDRLGVTGYSGGGHLSAWLIGHSDRFQAAVPEQGIYNMLSVWGVSDACGYFEYLMGGPPHERMGDYWRYSPLSLAHRVATPTLLIQGEEDRRCPMEQAEQYYAALKRAGCNVALVRMSDCYHAAEVAGPPPLRRARMDLMKDWFLRFLPPTGQSEQAGPMTMRP